MVRTKADNCARKAVAAKAPRKNLGVSSAVARAANAAKSPAGTKGKYRGGNSICPRPTPEWQKEITNFMIRSPQRTVKQKENVDPDGNEDEEAGCSKDDRSTEEIQGSSSGGQSSRLLEETPEDVENGEEDGEEEKDGEKEEETEEAGGSSSRSSKPNFVRNNCISDSEEDDE